MPHALRDGVLKEPSKENEGWLISMDVRSTATNRRSQRWAEGQFRVVYGNSAFNHGSGCSIRPSISGFGQEPSFTVCSLAPQPERPVRQCPPRFVVGGRRKAQAVFHSCGQKRHSPVRRSAIMPILFEVAPYDFRP
jgi:hypothetical protein